MAVGLKFINEPHITGSVSKCTNSYCIVLWFRPRACTYGRGNSICQLARKTPAVFFRIQTERIRGNTNNHTRTTRKACRKWDFFNPFEQILPAGPVMHNHCMETIELHLHDIRLQKILSYYYPRWVCQIVGICCTSVADQFPAYLQNASVLHHNKAYANWATAQNSASAMCPPPGRHCNRLGLCHHCGHWCVAIWRTCQQIGVSPRCNFASPP